jgi:hypothetical protein
MYEVLCDILVQIILSLYLPPCLGTHWCFLLGTAGGPTDVLCVTVVA